MTLVEAAADVICAVQCKCVEQDQLLCSAALGRHKVSSIINMSGGYGKHSLVFA